MHACSESLDASFTYSRRHGAQIRSLATPRDPMDRENDSCDGIDATGRAPPLAGAGGDRASATLSVDGVDHVMSHRVIGGEPANGYEPFLVAATPIVMAMASDLAVDGEVSPRLLNGLQGAQRILSDWYAPDLTRVEIDARPAAPGRQPGGRGVACFFSAGLDSFYSVVTNRERVDALVFAHGFDVWLDDHEQRERVVRLVRRAAAALELPLVEVETDVRGTRAPTRSGASSTTGRFGQHRPGPRAGFREVLIPGSAPETLLHPWGSHPDLDRSGARRRSSSSTTGP